MKRNTVARTSGHAIPKTRNTETPGMTPAITDNIDGKAEMGEYAARDDAALTRTRDPKTGLLRLRPGQAAIGCKLDDDLEERICGLIADGLLWEDAARLCSIDRTTAWRWKDRGKEEPESRYGVFLERIEMAELKSKEKIIRRIMTSTDERTLRWWAQNRWPREFKADHLQHEISGPDGSAIPMSLTNTVFQVNVSMSGPEPGEFRTIDHRPAAERERDELNGRFSPSSPIDDPFGR